MALPVIADVYRCAIESHLGDQHMANVIHVEEQTTTSATNIAQLVSEAWGADGGFTQFQTSDYELDNVHVTKLDGSSLSIDHDFSTADHTSGTQSGASVPSNVALVVALGTGARGRSHRGRIYVPAVHVSFVSSPAAHWSSTFIANIVDRMDAIRGVLQGSTANADIVVASYKLAEAFPITSVVARRDFGTQRGRARV
jgi:hypothetical protein